MAWTSAGLRWLDRRVARRAPLLGTPAPPLEGGQGVLPFSVPRDHASPIASSSGPFLAPQVPPDVPWFRLDPAQVGPLERQAHRHGWLASLCWCGTAGDVAARDRALAGLDAWLDGDRPGHGVGWVHTTDLTARLCHWVVSLALLGSCAGPGLRARLAGSAALHLEHLEARLSPAGSGDPRRALQLVGLAVGGLGWPALPGAAAGVGRALSALPEALGSLLHDDGGPRDGGLDLLPELLTHGLLLAALGDANRAPLPVAAQRRLRGAAHLLGHLLGHDGRLPGASHALIEPLLPLDQGPPEAAVHRACVARGWSVGPGLAGAGQLARVLVGSSVAQREAGVDPGGARALVAFRASGLVLGSAPVCGQPSRLIFMLHAGGGRPSDAPSACSLLWSLGGLPVLTSPHPAHRAVGLGGNVAHLIPARPAVHTELLRARLSERELCIRARAEGGGQGVHHREVTLRGQRLVVEDRFEPPRGGLIPAARAPRVRVGWQLGPAWDLAWDGGDLVGEAQGVQLRVQLDPGLTWSLIRGGGAPGGGWAVGPAGEPVPALLLHGEGPLLDQAAIRCSFSLS